VRGTDFFYWFYPYDNNHHKYTEYEAINGQSHHYTFSPESLQVTANEAAKALQVDIYGGDAIVEKNGLFNIIDLNDWPSFAPCRDVAAIAIADRIYQRFEQDLIPVK
jgi:glutathione synthase/RimK-type ligase-like ATP-grasp enzyme